MTSRIRPNPIRRPLTKAQRIANGCFSAGLHDRKQNLSRLSEVDRLKKATGMRCPG